MIRQFLPQLARFFTLKAQIHSTIKKKYREKKMTDRIIFIAAYQANFKKTEK